MWQDNLLDFEWYIQKGAKQGGDPWQWNVNANLIMSYHAIKITVTGRSRIVWRLREIHRGSNHNSEFPNDVVEKAHTFCWPRTTRTTNRSDSYKSNMKIWGGRAKKIEDRLNTVLRFIRGLANEPYYQIQRFQWLFCMIFDGSVQKWL